MAQDAITVTGIEQYQEALRKLQTDNPATKRALQAIIRRAIGEARKNVIRDAQDVLENDPRHAYKAVRNSVYKQIFGGQINILSSRHRGAPAKWTKPKKDRTENARGGNRRKRSERTMQIDSYEGADRGFILRFQNAGTVERETRYGKRGSLRARHWFGISSAFQMDAAASRVAEEIEKLLQQEFQQM
jgi:hypothetical protein